ncbi:hypothetical protein SV7mr_19950 [Stieleria bergensis]|uniref:Uncharacterized protein n=1 Tax=Stieleria bergensis TaxID=2528025 RepID=A0A517STN3_9BACT|nr:hypothetical protein SV7mr_19950 [Planctomycetes bacterium SV_7m_r]
MKTKRKKAAEKDRQKARNPFANNKPRKFDFARNWRRRIVPLLDDLAVKRCLDFGMM